MSWRSRQLAASSRQILALAVAVAAAACGSGKSEGTGVGWAPGDGSALDLSWSSGSDIKPATGQDGSAGDGAPADTAKPDTAGGDTAKLDSAVPDSAGGDAAPAGDLGDPDTGESDIANPEAVCGDSACTAGETWATCWIDCPPPPSVCGDGVCTPGENAIACQVDCDADTVGVIACLKKSCSSATTACLASPECTSFLANASQCLANCVDSNCVDFCKEMADQNPSAGAVASCGFAGCVAATAGTVCGDGTCDTGETTANCAPDCPAPPVSGGCGNGTCDSGEAAATCPLDCDADFAKAWACGAAKCPAEAAACKADPGCLDALTKTTNCMKQCGTGSSCVGQCRGPVLGNSKALSFAMCGLQNCQ
ncbi:MAG: hypothetical protein HY902_15345 [Deltaproteobacteria bacterium]|nr:hypothetical protein [Deltaproteobacteria bacterium]